MKPFYRLTLGDHGTGWFLGFPVDSTTRESIDHGPIVLDGRVPADLPRLIDIPIHQEGAPMNFSIDAFSLLFAGGTILEIFQRLCSDHVKFIDCLVDGKDQGIKMLVIEKFVECVDKSESEIVYHTAQTCGDDKGRIGEVYYILKLRVAAARVPEGIHIFRVLGEPTFVVVSSELKKALIAAGIQGAEFQKC